MFGYRHLFFLLILVQLACKSNNSIQKEVTPQLEYFNQLIEQSPFVDSLYFARATYYYDQNSYDEAIKDLSYAIRLDSLQARYFHLLADCYMEQGNSYEGLSTMVKAGILFPTRIPTLLKLSEYQNLLKQESKSLATINRILTLNPLESEAHFMAGINYRDLGDTAQAITSFKKATTYDDHLIDAWIILSQLVQFTDPVYARQCIENALRVDSTNTQTLHSYAEFFHESDPLLALSTYHKIILLDPAYKDAFLNSGILYFSIDSFAQALQHFDIACYQSPTEPTYYYYRGIAKEAMNDIEGARSDYNQALQLDANYTEAKKALEKLGQ